MCDACLSIAFVYFIFAIFSLKVFVYIINQESIKEHYFLGEVHFLFCFDFPAHLFINNQLPIPVDILNRQYYLIILSYVSGFWGCSFAVLMLIYICSELFKLINPVTLYNFSNYLVKINKILIMVFFFLCKGERGGRVMFSTFLFRIIL